MIIYILIIQICGGTVLHWSCEKINDSHSVKYPEKNVQDVDRHPENTIYSQDHTSMKERRQEIQDWVQVKIKGLRHQSEVMKIPKDKIFQETKEVKIQRMVD